MNMAEVLAKKYKNKCSELLLKARFFKNKKSLHDEFIKRSWKARQEYQLWESKYMELTSYEKLYAFIEYHYLSRKFKSDSDYTKGREKRIVDSYMESLKKEGEAFITRHESITGKNIYFYADLSIKTENRFNQAI
ncbi:hypothetical protein [Xenorhabdus ishibashii]|uniref:Uncharacterized protein n=1 Tax=Xenorhabdus ishibashii TaxID=1034471 RepID=A0A2D0K819_9GAMM|nr:hypothetical protein [Xenorhabdus ishibashii]PHM59532.1 hypothetical protein Xish_03651 [Xenorhabdus ishibashii]